MKISHNKFVSIDEFRARAREGASSGAPVQRFATGTATEVTGAERTLRFVFSDGTVDRAGDRISPAGWVLDSFRANPGALFAHASDQLPIGRVPGGGPFVVNSKLVGDIEFAQREDYQFADTVYRLAKGGFISAVSVGFNPLEFSFANDKDRPYGIDFKRQELLEISLCVVPCNANALIEARAKGISGRTLMEWAERALDEGRAAPLTRRNIEQTYRAAKTPAAIRRRIIA
jgi:HK97 family phage prohead protease